MIGKPAKAPCGHDGETVCGDYVRCLEGCDSEKSDGVPEHVDREDTLPLPLPMPPADQDACSRKWLTVLDARPSHVWECDEETGDVIERGLSEMQREYHRAYFFSNAPERESPPVTIEGMLAAREAIRRACVYSSDDIEYRVRYGVVPIMPQFYGFIDGGGI